MAVERTKILTARITLIQYADSEDMLPSDEDIAKAVVDGIKQIPNVDDAVVDLTQNFDMDK